METEMIDKLFLELSQVTKATTKKELELKKLIERHENAIKDQPVSVEDRLPEDVVTAIKQYMEAAEDECKRSCGGRWGYFSKGGWAHRVLSRFLEAMPPAPKE